MIETLKVIKPAVAKMWPICAGFVASGTEIIRDLQNELFIVGKGIPIPATFSAFMCNRAVPNDRALDRKMGGTPSTGAFR
jgi:hypothetical protein